MAMNWRRLSFTSWVWVISPFLLRFMTIRVRLGTNRLARLPRAEVSSDPISDITRKTRHCCSVIPVSASISRIDAITPSRARTKAMGKERAVVGKGCVMEKSELAELNNINLITRSQ